MKFDDRLNHEVESHPYPLLFATISGAHLYGFPSADSDWDLRGAHILPLNEVVGLLQSRETVETTYKRDGFEMDLVTHDIRKFMAMMLQPNGNVLEQLLSPIVVFSTEEHRQLVALAPRCLTRNHARHYRGFAAGQWKLVEQERLVKPLLYTYRVLLTGIHLMRTGELQANVLALNEHFKLPQLPELIATKVGGTEKERLKDEDLRFHRAEYDRLMVQLQEAQDQSKLPDQADAETELNQILVQLRLKGIAERSKYRD
jgi:uncharacterized protein